MSQNEKKTSSDNLIPYYKIYVYGEYNDRVEEILINPNINNALGGPQGIYSLISSKFDHQYLPMNHMMKIKFANIWYTINDINTYNFFVSGNLSSGDNIHIKLLQNTNDTSEEKENENTDIFENNKIAKNPIPKEKKLACSLCRQNSEYLYEKLLKLF